MYLNAIGIRKVRTMNFIEIFLMAFVISAVNLLITTILSLLFITIKLMCGSIIATIICIIIALFLIALLVYAMQ